MVAILQSKSPKSISCTSQKVNIYQRSHTTLIKDTKNNNLDLASSSTSTSDRCLTSSTTPSTKIFYLPAEKNISTSIVPNLTPIDNISNHKQHYHHSRSHSVSKPQKNSNSVIEETAIDADNNISFNSFENTILGDNNSYKNSLDSPSCNEKSINIQSFKDTVVDSVIAITPPSTTPTTPTTPLLKDFDSLDKSLSSIKNSIETEKDILKSKNTPNSKSNTPLVHTTSSHYTKNTKQNSNNNNNNNCIGTINHPKIIRDQFLKNSENNSNNNNNNKNNNNNNLTSSSIMHSKLLNSRDDIRDKISTNDNFESNYIKDTTLSKSHSIPSITLKVKRNLNGSHYKCSRLKSENKENLISLEFK